jgi:hypothetical protein
MKMKEEEEKSALEEKRCGRSGYVPDAAVVATYFNPYLAVPPLGLTRSSSMKEVQGHEMAR